MSWLKRGFIYTPESTSWMHKYAQVPTPLVYSDFIRVFFGCRPRNDTDALPISQIGYVDVARDDPTKIRRIAAGPVLSLGGRGTFDEFGLHPLSVLRVGAEIWMYYVGWTRMQSVPFNRAIGLAISRDDGLSFERIGQGPVLGQTHNEPYLQEGPSVQIIDNTWHMWYLSGINWIEYHGRMEAIYQIMHATSDNGIHWNRDGKIILPTVEEHECQAGQSVIKRNGQYHMWFSFRRGLDFRNADGGYKMGYATSDDLVNWTRDDSKAGIEKSKAGWDSEMVAYPNIVEVDGKALMFYCGNYFGRDGFGFAELSF
jgi:hypothetical protein